MKWRAGRAPARVAIAASCALIALGAWLRLGPLDPRLLDASRLTSLTVVDRNGEVLYEPLGAEGNRSESLRADRLSPHVVAATIAAEDQRFFSHPGIDPLAVMRAAAHDVRAMRFAEGGSTISQQVAKLLLGPGDRGVGRKLREAVVALRLEHRLTKREILALYLNLAPYGNRISGIARASRAYFGCGPENLTPAQAAYLASLPQRPGAFNPLRDPSRVVTRQRAVLQRMRANGAISGEEALQARAERLRFTPAAQPVTAMHFVEEVLARTPGGGSHRIVTTLDARLQREVAGIIAAHRDDLLRHGAHAAAVAVLDNATGEWLAWEGSGDYFGSSFGGAIDGVTTPRQPGSALKPFTYAVAFESGATPATVLADVPSHFPTAEKGVVYTPRNYDGQYRGPLRARAALAGSENVPAVAMLARVGPESLLRLLRNAGFTTLDHTSDYYGLGLTLGDAEVTLEQLVTGYATFARGGVAVRPSMLRDARPRIERRVVTPRTAFWISDILSDSDARAYVFGEESSLDLPFPVAVKTGTSQAYRDNWTVGYTRDVTVGVWVGNFDRRELRGSSGVTGAAPIFHAVMLAAMKRARGALPVDDTAPVVAPTPDVEQVDICALSGLRPSPWCPAVRKEWMPSGASPQFCSWHHDGAIDWPSEYRAWARANAPTPTVPQVASSHASPVRITNPPNGATYLIDPTLRMEFQTVRLRAAASTRVAWNVDGRPLGSIAADRPLDWPLQPGAHTVTAIDERGARDSVRIYVK